jgi:hypothetical protein
VAIAEFAEDRMYDATTAVTNTEECAGSKSQFARFATEKLALDWLVYVAFPPGSDPVRVLLEKFKVGFNGQ